MGHNDTPNLTMHVFFVLCMYRAIQTSTKHRRHPNRGCPNIQGGISGPSKDTGSHPNMRASKDMWHQTYRWHPNIWEHPNVWGHMDTHLVWQSMLSLFCVCTGGIQNFFWNNPELYLPSWISAISFFLNPELYVPSYFSTILDFHHLVFFLILNILSIPLSFALYGLKL